MPTRNSSNSKSLRSDVNQYGASGSQGAERASQGAGNLVNADIIQREFRIAYPLMEGRPLGSASREMAIDLFNRAYSYKSKYSEAMNGEVPDSPYVMDALDTLENMGNKWFKEGRQPTKIEAKEYLDFINRGIEAVDYQTKQDIGDLMRDAGL